MGTKKYFEAVLWGASKKGLNLEKSFFFVKRKSYTLNKTIMRICA